MALFSQPVFLNLPSTDTERIREFWTALGADIIEDFSDEDTVCVELTESTYALYMSAGSFGDLIGENDIADSFTSHESLLSLMAGTPEDVDALAERALGAGADEVLLPADLVEDLEQTGRHSREILDPDGHQWEFVAS